MPNRILRTSALTSRKLHAVSDGAENLYYRLLLVADDYGCYFAEPTIVRSACYPTEKTDSGHVAARLRELLTGGLIGEYTSGGERYLALRKWEQRIDKRSKRKFPEPPRNFPGLPGESLPVVDVDVDVVVQTLDQPRADRVRFSREDFERFWQAYPRKVGKAKAEEAFRRAQRRIDAAVIVAGAARLRDDPNLPEARYIPHPTTWLARGGWEDEPLPPREGAVSPPKQAERDSRDVLGYIEEMDAE